MDRSRCVPIADVCDCKHSRGWHTNDGSGRCRHRERTGRGRPMCKCRRFHREAEEKLAFVDVVATSSVTVESLSVVKKICRRCVNAHTEALWECRGCGRFFCKHFCQFKEAGDRTAICGRCLSEPVPPD